MVLTYWATLQAAFQAVSERQGICKINSYTYMSYIIVYTYLCMYIDVYTCINMYI
jgi:hypothetical protein